MKLAIVTDAWKPQVNGVVTTLQRTSGALTALGHHVTVLSPDGHATLPCPTYPEIRLVLWPYRRLAAMLDACVPDAIHIATEGPLGMAAARYCRKRSFAFTTSYHTQFPQYVRKRAPIPERWTYALLRRHHGRARRTLVATESQRRELVANGFTHLVLWSRGVDTQLFKPSGREHLALPRPIFAYMGRVAVEKNLDAFLGLELPGTKVVVGDGPDRALLEARYPGGVFVGYRFGVELAQCLSSAPVDVVEPGVTGVLDEHLGNAALAALELDRERCHRAAQRWTWERASRQFLSHLVRACDGADLAARDPHAEPCVHRG